MRIQNGYDETMNVQNGRDEIDKLSMVRYHELLVRSVLVTRVAIVAGIAAHTYPLTRVAFPSKLACLA
jgi:hypothetical protein